MNEIDVSKEICVLCNIKPKIVQDYELNDIELYPNFYNPNNFIELIELPFTKSLTVGKYIQKSEDGTWAGWYDRTTFLNKLTYVLRYKEIRRVVLMARAIRNMEWEY